LRLTDIYCQSGKHAEAAELFGEMQRKFKTSCKVWLAAISFYMTRSRDLVTARRTLPVALKALPSRKHVKLTLKCAQLEYKQGEPERARTLFEGLLAAHPKRLDLWLVYVQMEENMVLAESSSSASTSTSRDLVRRIYERALTLKVSSKKAKTLFKGYLAFEKAWGDGASVEHVKQLARDYVEGRD
jgi:rRNA biogenesis protein RRP5